MSIVKGLTSSIVSPLVLTEGGSVPNPIDDLDNIITDVDFSDADAYTFSSGVVIDSVAARSGISMDNIQSPEYDSTAFGGKGGALITSNIDGIRQASDFTNTATQTIIIAVNLPVFAAIGDVINLATGTGNGSTISRILYISAVLLQYRSEEASNYDMMTSGIDGTHIFALRYNSTSSLDIYVDSTTAQDNVNPDDDYSTRTRLRLGTRTSNTGVADSSFGYLLHTSDALTNDEMTDVITYLASEFGATLS